MMTRLETGLMLTKFNLFDLAYLGSGEGSLVTRASAVSTKDVVVCYVLVMVATD